MSLRTRMGALALFLLVQLCLASGQPAPLPAVVYPDTPQDLFKDLFVAVQGSNIYVDGKAFVDAVPNRAPAEIYEKYQAQRPATPEALRHFVETYFTLPPDAGPAASQSAYPPIAVHIDSLWDPLTRSAATALPYSSQLPLPYRYVVPGGRFRELYYWDSYFTMLGLIESGRRDLVEDMVRDFAFLIDTYGHVPNGTRSYYLSRSQPPFFFEMVGLLSADQPAKAFAQYLPQLKREYAFWMEGSNGLGPGTAHRRVVALPDGSVLNRYWDDRDTPREESYRVDVELARTSRRDPQQLYRDLRAAAESGWDFGSRWYADAHHMATIDTTEIIPVDLNSLLFGLESAIQAGCERTADKNCARDFARRATARRAAIDHYLWDRTTGTYLDYRWTKNVPVPRLSAATLYPLFVNVASAAQASAVAQATARELLKDGGIVTTPLNTGAQWDAPNGWAPLQWIAVAGLRANAQPKLAEIVACRWMVGVNRTYEQSGKLVEKYDVIDLSHRGGGGEYPLQDGFGWTNGVMRKLMALYPADAADSTIDQCPH